MNDVVAVNFESVQREVGGLLWWFETGSGALQQLGGWPFYVGSACTGPLYGYSGSASPPYPQRVYLDRGTGAFHGFSDAGPFRPMANDDSVSFATGNSCETRTFSGENENPQVWTGFWPLTPAPTPSNLVGPLRISAQN